MCRNSRANVTGSALSRLPITVVGIPAARQRADVHVEVFTRQPPGQDQELLLGPGPVERRNDVEDAGHGG